MHDQQDPIINNWYTNLTGKLFKVRMAAYEDNSIGCMVIEYIDGAKQIITRQEWDCLKLAQHNAYPKDSKSKQSLNRNQSVDSKTTEETIH